MTLDEISEDFLNVSRTKIHKVVTKTLKYRKIFARWVSRMLDANHKSKQMVAALSF